MSEIQIVKIDEGGVNARILAKETKADFRRVEAASLKIPTRFTSAEGKRFDGAEVLFKAHAITSTATYDTVPLDVEVHVLSSSGRRFLEVLGKLDQLMPLLQTLEIHEVITTQAVDIQRASLKRQVRDIANGARNFAMGLRRRMNAMGARDGEGRSAEGRQETAVVDSVDEPKAEGDGEVEPAVMNSDTRLSEALESDPPSVDD